MKIKKQVLVLVVDPAFSLSREEYENYEIES
jgi:hypothetical protein